MDETRSASRPDDGGPLSALLRELAAEGPRDVAPAPSPGARVGGRYVLLRELGSGGFGRVFAARDEVLGREVALKFLLLEPGRVVDEAAIAEAELVARLDHPGIVAIHDRGTDAIGPFLVLELLEGESLSRRIARGPVEPEEAVRIALELARALAHAHVRGVVHRDLKPGNVFVCLDGSVKVLDFGLARLLGRGAGASGGTPGWLAPEQVRGRDGDERTDVWALGALLRRMLAGPDGQGDGAPAELDALLEVMLAESPGARPRDAARVVEALEPIARRVAERPPRSWPRRRTVAVVAGAFAALAAAAAFAIAAHRAPGPASDPSVAVLPFEDLSPGHDHQYLSDGVSEEILSVLSRVEGLRVAGRESSFRFRSGATPRQIAAELGVAHLLVGTVRLAGERLRITAGLVRGQDGRRVWTENYDGDLADVFDVQSRIARAVGEELTARLAPASASVAMGRRTTPRAYEDYLLGRREFAGGTFGYLDRAVAAFERAVAADPSYAPAWAGLGSVLYERSDTRGQDGLEAVLAEKRRALEAAEKAVRLGPELPDGYVARAKMVDLLDWDWATALADADRGVALAPGDTHAYRVRANLRRRTGDLDGARADLERAITVDPLDPHVWVTRARLARETGDEEQLRRSLQRLNELGSARMELAEEEAVPRDRMDALDRTPLAGLGCIELNLLAGLRVRERRPDARTTLEEMGRRCGVGWAWQLMSLYGRFGDREAAIGWLERAFAWQDAGVKDLPVYVDRPPDPWARQMRDDPRVQAILRKMRR